MKLVDGEGIEHNITVASGPTQIESSNRGLLKVRNPNVEVD